MNLRELMQLAWLFLGEATTRPLEGLTGVNRVRALEALLSAVADRFDGIMLAVSVGHRGVAFAVSLNRTVRQWYMRSVADDGAFGVGAGDYALARMTDQLLRVNDDHNRSLSPRESLRSWNDEEARLVARAFLAGGAEGVFWPDPFTSTVSSESTSQLVKILQRIDVTGLATAYEVLPATASWRSTCETLPIQWADPVIQARLEIMFAEVGSPTSLYYQI